MRETANKNNYENVVEIIDDGKTGRNFNREGIKKVIKMAIENKMEYVLVLRIDRFGRSLLEGTLYAILLFINNVGIVTADNNRIWNFNELEDMLIFIIKQYASQEESINIGKRTNSTKIMKFKEGKWIGPIPYGYIKDDKNEWIKIREDTVNIIRKLFQNCISSKNYKEGISNYGEEFKKYFKVNLTRDRLKNIFKNPIYKGFPHYGAIEKYDKSLAIISLDIFNQVQNLISSKKTGKRPVSRKNEFLDSIMKKFNLKNEELRDLVIRVQDLKPFCKNGHGPMVNNGYTRVKKFLVPNYKCNICSYERPLIQAYETDKYNVPIQLSCPICRTVDYFSNIEGANKIFKYTCKRCGNDFFSHIPPDKYNRRKYFINKNKEKSSIEIKTDQKKLDIC
jgi:DNA invertase Pin-like site-specific DNA recombinase